jgi:GNAT superfamily N-acetyltransferase
VEPRLVIQPLGREHDRAAFSCNVQPLDTYIRQMASQDVKRAIAAVFVGCLPESPKVIVGYYSLSGLSIVPQDLPPEATKGYPRYPFLPAVLLGRLAVDHRYKGQHFGSYLLMSALRRSLEGSKQIAAMAIVVDALDESAASFYEHHEFRRFPDNPLRLYIPMSTVTKIFRG